MIPPELIALISSHALFASPAHSPVLLEIPPNFTLSRLSILRDARIQQYQQSISIPMHPQPQQHVFRTRSNITDALQAAISTGMRSGTPVTGPEAKLAEQPFLTGFIPETSLSVALSLKTISQPMTLHPHPNHLLSSDIVEPIRPPSTPSSAWPTEPPISNLFLTPPTPAFTIGNLYLSSCPGKKGISKHFCARASLIYFE